MMNTPPNKSIRAFVARFILVAITPVMLIAGLYVWLDPYNVLRGGGMPDFRMREENPKGPHLSLNKGYLSVLALEKRIEAGDVPDSFIFGASITCYYELEYWRRLIDTDIMPLHFDSSAEGARSMRMKLEYLRRRGVKLKNALLILDPKTIGSPVVGDNIMTIDHPYIAGWWTWPRWHYKFFSAFCDREFLISYLPSRFTHQSNTYGHSEIFDPQPIVYNPYLNEESLPSWDCDIRSRGEQFYACRDFPSCRVPHCSCEHLVDAERENEYRLIVDLLEGTDYHVAVTPTLDRDTLSASDDECLSSIFGREHYHNFTSEMSYVALRDSNWYDTRHYRAPVARMIMDKIYKSMNR